MEKEKIKDAIAIITFTCAIFTYFIFAICIIACLAIVIPWAATASLVPILRECSVFCQLLTFLTGFGLLSIIVFFAVPSLCAAFHVFHGWLVKKLLQGLLVSMRFYNSKIEMHFYYSER